MLTSLRLSLLSFAGGWAFGQLLLGIKLASFAATYVVASAVLVRAVTAAATSVAVACGKRATRPMRRNKISMSIVEVFTICSVYPVVECASRICVVVLALSLF